MAGWILKLAQSEPELVQVAIEVPHGPVVESLLNRGFQVHSINPRQLDRFRDRFSPAGAKDDSRDAPVLADALRTDPRCLRRLEPLDPLLVELREWSRIAEELTRLRTRLSHRLRDQLWRYYPQFLDLGSDLANNWMLALWAVVPTPDRARMVSKATIAKLLKTHRIRRLDAAGVLARLRTDPLPVAASTTAAATAHIQVLSSSLNMLNEQLSEALERLEHCTEQLAASNDRTATEPARQSDGAILMSLPGVGQPVLATLLAEASDPLRRRDYHALRCLCGKDFTALPPACKPKFLPIDPASFQPTIHGLKVFGPTEAGSRLAAFQRTNCLLFLGSLPRTLANALEHQERSPGTAEFLFYLPGHINFCGGPTVAWRDVPGGDHVAQPLGFVWVGVVVVGEHVVWGGSGTQWCIFIPLKGP